LYNSTIIDGIISKLLLAAFTPILWVQSRRVRRNTPSLPEATGLRHGTLGAGEPIKLLVIGDSGAAGVGVQFMNEGLCGQLVEQLSQDYCVHWRVLAVKGLDSPGMIGLLSSAFEPASSFDVVVLSLGANDATALCFPDRWSAMQQRVAYLIQSRFKPSVLVHTAVPPMHACLALPQPLRWFMGRWARQMNQHLTETIQADLISRQNLYCKRSVHWHPESTTTEGMCIDGIHPSARGYTKWAHTLSAHIRSQL
jgi:lysophospholipase L1-like esterase